MRLNHSINLVQSSTCNKVKKTGRILFLEIILLQAISSCNPGANYPTTNVFPTTTATFSPALSPTNIATISPIISPSKTYTITPTFTTLATPDYSHTIDRRINLRFDIGAEDNSRSFIDLDTMEIGDTPKSDLQFYVTRGSMEWIWLSPINGARTKARGTNKLTLEDCYKEPALATLTQSDAYIGNHLCALSNKGRLFLLFIEDIVAKPDYASISLLITTYL